MQKTIASIGLVAIGLALIFLVYSQSSSELIGKELGGFTVKNSANENININPSESELTLVHFWATWCPPCVKEIPSLNLFYNKFKGKKIKLIAISADDSFEEIQDFIKKRKMKIDFEIFLANRKVLDQFGVNGFPESILLDPKGQVLWKIPGTIEWQDEKFLSKRITPYLNMFFNEKKGS